MVEGPGRASTIGAAPGRHGHDAGATGGGGAIAARWNPSRTIAGVRLPRLSPRAYQRITLLALITLVMRW